MRTDFSAQEEPWHAGDAALEGLVIESRASIIRESDNVRAAAGFILRDPQGGRFGVWYEDRAFVLCPLRDPPRPFLLNPE